MGKHTKVLSRAEKVKRFDEYACRVSLVFSLVAVVVALWGDK